MSSIFPPIFISDLAFCYRNVLPLFFRSCVPSVRGAAPRTWRPSPWRRTSAPGSCPPPSSWYFSGRPPTSKWRESVKGTTQHLTKLDRFGRFDWWVLLRNLTLILLAEVSYFDIVRAKKQATCWGGKFPIFATTHLCTIRSYVVWRSL